MIPKLDSATCLLKAKRWGPVVFWMIVIFSASADSGSVAHSSRIIDPICFWLWPDISVAALETIHFLVRKSAHMTEYALLALLLLRALSHERGEVRRWISSAWVLATAYAASDELHQLFVEGRNGSFIDVLIDSAGAALGLFAYSWVVRRRSEKAALQPIPAEVGVPAAHSLPHRPTFADQLLCILQGEDVENRSQVRFEVQDRLQREHGGRLVLGRNGQTAHLCIKNTSVSGQHLALIFRNGQVEVEDMGSSNGTRVNGRKLDPFRPAPIADGDRIEAGEVLLHFRRLA